MPLKQYGVLVGRPIEGKTGRGRSSHFHVHIDDGKQNHRIAINIKSQAEPSELLFLMDEQFNHPVTDGLEFFDPGFHPLKSAPGAHAIDFIRGNLFKPKNMGALPKDLPGPDNDLNEKISYFVDKAIRNPNAKIYAFGEKWGPDNTRTDRYFGFKPSNGVHDIHMNQGNIERFSKDDGVYQDGALLIHFPGERRWVALFLAFQSQSWHTDDLLGHTIDFAPPHREPSPERVTTPEPPKPSLEMTPDKETEAPTIPSSTDPEREPIDEGLIRIIAAQVNLPGSDKGKETVTLLNRSPETINLNGWAIADKHKRKEKIGDRSLTPGKTLLVRLSGKASQLTNKGGIITLLDHDGLKVDGVSYDKEAGKAKGWTILF